MEYRLTVVVMQFLFLCVDLIILYNSSRHRDNSNNHQTSFTAFAICIVIQQFVAVLSQVINLDICSQWKFLHYLIYIILFSSMTACSYTWFLYLRQIVSGGEKTKFYHRELGLLPLAIIAVTSLASPKTHWVFYIDENGMYQRGSLMVLQMLCPYIYVIMAIVLAFFWKKKRPEANTSKMLRYFILFMAPSVFCVFIQMFIVQGGFSSIGISLGLLMIYLELYINDINENKRLKSIEALHNQLQKAHDDYHNADIDRRTDFLTGLRNRLDLFELIQEAIEDDNHEIYSMFMMDIDNFKQFNDHYGHEEGDKCLSLIGHALLEYGKQNNVIFYRYGGEELLGVLVKNSDKTDACIANEIIELVRQLNIVRDDLDKRKVTISLGYTSDNSRYEKMIGKADKALYMAKSRGKDCSVADGE